MWFLLPHAVGFALVLLVGWSGAFNLDTEIYTRHRGEPNTMFGFSVSMHREAGQSWILVGSPKAQTNQPGVTQGGAVYACEIGVDDSCSQIPFDTTGNNNDTSDSKSLLWLGASGYNFGNNNDSLDHQIDSKSFQWFGASVYSAGEDGPVVACAPMYIYFSIDNKRREPVGTCFLARNQFREFLEYSPCRTRNWGHHRQGFCQVGFGVSISRDGERLFIGAVGSRYWQGELYSVDDRKKLPFVPPMVAFYDKGMIVSWNLHSRPDVISTHEGHLSDDDTYMGYSMAVGDFGGTILGHEDVAVGRPRAAGLLGQVLLFTWNTTSIQNLTGEQLGAYFGYAIAVGDIDGDKRDDLIVGAPFYTDMKNNEGNYETGRVYIIYQGNQRIRFNQVHVKDGKNSKGRFGLSLTSLGDINKDGYGDFAVGAPYDGPDERGAVYIFHGSANGVRDTHSQVIFSENIVGSPSTFGFSIAGKLDLDENEYPDLVVGAYDSNTVVYLRARPVVKVDATISFAGEGKQIGLDEKNCTLRDRTRVPCIQLSSCLQYDGIGVDETLDFEVQFVLDSKKPKNPRMFLLLDENRNIMNHSLKLNKGEKLCKDMFAFLKTNIRDKLTSIDAEIRYSLLTNHSQSRRLARQLTPVLDLNQELSSKDSIVIKKNCGKDNICIPDLRLIAQPNVKRYLLGSGERLNLNVLVQNEGEDAFEATFETSIPPGLNYVKIERIDEAEREIPVQCSAPSFLNNNTLHCDIGNPLPKEKLVEFRVILQPYHLDGMNPRYEFHMNVNSTNPENSSSVSDNFKKIVVPIWVETDLILHGSSHPGDVYYNSSLYEKTHNFTHESEIGPQVIHVYGIRNKGPSDIVEAVAYFLWPSYTLAGDHLLYLLEQPETLGNIKCDYVEEVNVENIALDRKKKSFLDPHAEIGIQAGLHSESGSSSSSTYHSSSSSQSVAKETYASSSGFSQFSSQGGVVTEEERRRIEEEITRREKEEAAKATGDGSFRQIQGQRDRGKITDEHSHYSTNGGRLISESHSRPVYVEERGRVEISKAPVVSESSYFHKDFRKQEGSNSGSRQGSSHRGGAGAHSYYGEKEEVSNTTWRSGQAPKTSTMTKWKTVEDGVEKSGSSSGVENGIIGGNINLANLGLSSAGNRKYTIGGGVGERFYSEEKQEKNITWDSRDGIPKVSESTSWKTNEDGVIRSGSSRKSSQLDERTNINDKRIIGVNSSRGVVHGSSYHQSEINRGVSGPKTTVEQEGSGISEDSRLRQNWDSGYRSHNQSTYEGKTQSGFYNPAQNGGDNRTSFSEERHHSKTSTYGEELVSGGRRVHGESYGNEDRTSYPHNRHTGINRTHIGTHGSEGRVSSGARKSEGKHKVHWSSEHSRGSETRSQLGGSGVITDGETSRVIGEGSHGQSERQGNKSYNEERQYEWNTTWSSANGGKPKTTELTSWKINENGVVTNGSNKGSFEGTAKFDKNLHKHLTVTNVGSGGIDIDQNFIKTGKEGTVYSEEKETIYNTTWNSATGGVPTTQIQSKWKVNKDGKISNGSISDVYKGTAPPFQHGESNIQGGSSHESRRHGTIHDSRHEENRNRGSSYYGEGYNRESHDSVTPSYQRSHGSARSGYGSLSHHQGHGLESSAHESSSHQQGHDRHHIHYGSRESRIHEGTASEDYHGTRHEDSRQLSGTTNINVGDLLKGNQASGSQSASFNQFGDIARGPSDGVARTYGLDLGTYVGSQDHSSSQGGIREGDSISRHYSSERSGPLKGIPTVDQEASKGYSYKNSDRLEGGSGRIHSSWSSSYSSSTADGDRPQHGGSYGIKVSEDSYHQKVSDGSTRGKFQLYPRYKRETNEDLEKSLNCGPTDCSRIKCTLGPLKKDEEVWVAFRSRVWVPTMKKLSTSVEVGLSSLVAAKVTKMPHIGTPDVVTTHTHEVHSKIMPPDTGVKPDIIPLWIVVVSACAGAIILMLLVYLLYKCGFFKRNRPSSAPEKQPLNRNGHYHGDEAL